MNCENIPVSILQAIEAIHETITEIEQQRQNPTTPGLKHFHRHPRENVEDWIIKVNDLIYVFQGTSKYPEFAGSADSIAAVNEKMDVSLKSVNIDEFKKTKIKGNKKQIVSTEGKEILNFCIKLLLIKMKQNEN